LSRIVSESAASGEGMPAGFSLLAVCLLFVFCLKGAVFPLWFWLPDTYHTMPSPVGALFAALLSKVGVYAILRLFPSVFGSPLVEGLGVVDLLLAVLAGATMVVAIVSACAAHDVRRLLAMVLIAHVGYLVFGVSMMRGDAFAGALHYMAQEMLVMAGLFVAVGVIEHRTGTTDLRELGGLHRAFPVLSGLFFVLSISLIGIPPLSGFFGKTVLIREGFASGSFALAGATVLAAVLTLVAVGRMWTRLFWGEARGPGIGVPAGAEAGPSPVRWTAYAGLACLSFASVGVGLAAEPTLGWARAATAELIDPGRYRAAVLGGAGGEGDADGTPAEARALLGHRLGGVGGDGPADPTREVTR
jgi:multicomponent Na+:H+ antiporter subunit D